MAYNQLIFYFFVGLVCATVDILLSRFLYESDVSLFFSSTSGFFIATLLNYFLSRRLVFSKSIVGHKISLIKLFVVSIIALILNTSVVAFLVEALFFSLVFSKVIAIGVVFFWNFYSRKFFVFKV
jgi:putative flippase GtrA